jgi:O-glycosyl hydrolase
LKHEGDHYRGFERTKQYYLVGQFSRFIKPGARRVKTDSPRGSIRTSAFRKENDLTLIGVNAGSAPRRVTFSFEPGSDISVGALRAIRTGKQENWRELGNVKVVNNSFTVTLPPNSVTTFTNLPTESLAASEP